MPQTLEQINSIRQKYGQDPLAELPVEKPVEQKLPENEDGKVIEEKKQEEKKLPKVEEKPKEEKVIVAAELSDEAVIKYLQGKGLPVNSFEDLNKPLTEADLQKQAEQRENAKLSYGLDKGLFNRKTHEQFILDRSNKKDLVFAQYYQDAKKEDPELSDEDIQAEYATRFGLDAEPGTRKYKRGEQEIDILGEIILRNKYANIYKLDSEYDVHESTSKQQQEFERKVKLGAPVFKKDVDDIFTDLKKVTIKVSDTESYEIDDIDDALNNLKEKFFDKNFVAQKISEGYTKDELKQVAYTALLSENLPMIVQKAINQALLKKQKGVQGVMSAGPQEKQGEESQMSEKQKAIINRLFPNQVPVAN